MGTYPDQRLIRSQDLKSLFSVPNQSRCKSNSVVKLYKVLSSYFDCPEILNKQQFKVSRSSNSRTGIPFASATYMTYEPIREACINTTDFLSKSDSDLTMSFNKFVVCCKKFFFLYVFVFKRYLLFVCNKYINIQAILKE